MRIVLAGISHEALGTSPLPTGTQDFRVQRGAEVLSAAPYFLGALADQLGIEAVPILNASSIAPGGTLELAAYLEFRDEILAGLRAAGPLDGVCLLLHGALQVEHIWSGEADLVRAIRAQHGSHVRIAAQLDLHANLNDEFANRTDIWTGFRTAPHRDAVETTHRALRLLVKTLSTQRRPRPAFIRVPLLLQGEKATTDVEPMRSLEAMARQIESEPGMLNAEVFVGFGWADTPDASSSVAVIAEDETHLPAARAHALRLAQAMWDRRLEFTFDQEIAATVDDALEIVRSAPESSVWLTDSGDNPTAGTPGDSTYFLKALLDKGVTDAVVASIPDAAAWRVCRDAGAGATVQLELGGHWDTTRSGPLNITGIVEHVSSDEPVATVKVGGVRVIVSGLRKAITRLDDFRNAGIDPLAHKIVVVKLGYLMPELRDAAPREILVLTPGYSDMELERLPYRYLTRPIFPLDGDFAWRPRISNVAGYVD